jgi:uncharacterized protein
VTGAVLLDVNVLVAIAWPNHVHHAMARAWFIDHRSGGWATCPVTESGFVRVSSNVKAIPAAVSPAAALELLIRLRQQPGHVFWPDDVSLADSSDVPKARLISYTQVTDAHLLALARRHSGRIATFDRGLVALAEPTGDEDIVLLDQLPRQRGTRD